MLLLMYTWYLNSSRHPHLMLPLTLHQNCLMLLSTPLMRAYTT